MTSIDPATGNLTYINQVNIGAGDFMFKSLPEDRFHLKLITIRDVVQNRRPEEYLDYLMGNKFFNMTFMNFSAPQAVLKGVAQGLVAVHGREKGEQYFNEWL